MSLADCQLNGGRGDAGRFRLVPREPHVETQLSIVFGLSISSLEFAAFVAEPCPRWFPTGIKREHGAALSQRRGCPRNCKRRAARQSCHWATGKAAQSKDPRAMSQETCHQPWSRAKAPGGVHRGGQELLAARVRRSQVQFAVTVHVRCEASVRVSPLQTAKRGTNAVCLCFLIHPVALVAGALAETIPPAARRSGGEPASRNY